MEVRKIPLKKNELRADRIEDATEIVTPKICRGWIRRSQKFFSKCMDIETL